MSIRELIEAVGLGEYQRDDGIPRYSKMVDTLDDLGLFDRRLEVLKAMHAGVPQTIAILRALEQEGRDD